MPVPPLTVILSVEPPDSGHCPMLKPSPTIYPQHSHTCLNTACSSLVWAVFSSLRPVPLLPELVSFLLVSGPVLGHLLQEAFSDYFMLPQTPGFARWPRVVVECGEAYKNNQHVCVTQKPIESCHSRTLPSHPRLQAFSP